MEWNGDGLYAILNTMVSCQDAFSLLKCRAWYAAAATAAKSLQWCPTLCDPIDGSPPGSPIPGILQARTLEWVAISFSNEWKWKWKWSRVRLLSSPWTAAYQAPPSMGFSRQEYWSRVPLPSPETDMSRAQDYKRQDVSNSICEKAWRYPVKHLFCSIIERKRNTSFPFLIILYN